jgi:L-Ala-D/L-Glu epimerase
MKLIVHSFRLRTRKTFTTSHGSADHRNCLIVELQADGHSGYGEATEILYYGKDLQRMVQLLAQHQSWLETLDLIEPRLQYIEFLKHFFTDRFVLCAVDMAYHDLWGKLHSRRLVDLWGFDTDRTPVSSLTVGIASIPEMLAHIDENPWPIYKIKLGTQYDMEIMEAIRAHTDSVLRVDINAGWTPEQTIQNSRQFRDWNIEFIEQPLDPTEDLWMPEVYRESMVPLIADESCHIPEDIERCRPYFHGINIKLMKCGGLTPALEMIRMARDQSLLVMIGCMTETSIGISALAAIAPLVDYADMDGALLISNDPATGIKLDMGQISYSGENGTGAQLQESQVILS